MARPRREFQEIRPPPCSSAWIIARFRERARLCMVRRHDFRLWLAQLACLLWGPYSSSRYSCGRNPYGRICLSPFVFGDVRDGASHHEWLAPGEMSSAAELVVEAQSVFSVRFGGLLGFTFRAILASVVDASHGPFDGLPFTFHLLVDLVPACDSCSHRSISSLLVVGSSPIPYCGTAE